MTYPVHCRSCLGIHPVAAIGLPGSDVREAFVSTGVDPRVQEAEYGFAGAKTRVVQKCNDSGSDLSEVSKNLPWSR